MHETTSLSVQPSWRRLVRVPARVINQNHLLGPFSTPAAVLRWRAHGPLDLWCAASGWFGPDLRLALLDGSEVTIPLNRLRLDAPRQAWSPGIELPRPIPEFLWRASWRGATSWWELSLLEGMELELDAVVPRPSVTSYRTLATEEPTPVAREATVHLRARV